ncbi:MAG: CHAD domain-containing protein [Bryobacteraceae bacterium]
MSHVNQGLSAAPIQEFARFQLDERLKRVEKEWGRCAGTADEIAIHDFRVALRRFGEGLWLFRRLFPKHERRQVREELRAVMRLSARVRDVDIVMGSFTLAAVTVSPEILLFLQNERSIAEAAFEAALAVGLRTEAGKRWRQTLQLVPEVATAAEAVPASEAIAAAEEVIASTDEAAHTVAEADATSGEAQP